MNCAPPSTLTLPSAPRTGFQLGGCAADPAHRECPRPGASPRPTATSGCVPPSSRGDTISQGFVENMDFHQLCPGENPGEVKGWQRLQPSQSSWLHLQNRHGHFLQQVLPRCLAWPVHRAAHRHTDGGTRGNSPAQAGREDEAVPLQGWGQAGDAAGVLTGPLGPARAASPGTPAPCISSRESSRNTRTGVDSCHRPGHVYRKRNTHVSARTRDNTHTYVRK